MPPTTTKEMTSGELLSLIDQVGHDPDGCLAQERGLGLRPIHRLGQGEFEQVADGDAQPLFAALAEKEAVGVASHRPFRVRFVGQQVVRQDQAGMFAEQPAGKPDPGVLPDSRPPALEEGVKFTEHVRGQIAAPGPSGEVAVVSGVEDGLDQIHRRGPALHRHLELVFHANAHVRAEEGLDAGARQPLLAQGGSIDFTGGQGVGGEGNGHGRGRSPGRWCLFCRRLPADC